MLTDKDTLKREKTYEDNKKVLGAVHYTLQKDYRKLGKKAGKQERIEEYMNDVVTLGTRENKLLITALSIPSAIGLIAGAVSGIGVLALGSVIANNQGINLSEASQNALNMVQNSLNENTNNMIHNFTTGIKFLSLPALGTLISYSCKIVRGKNDIKYASSLNKMCDKDEIIKLIDDLKKNKTGDVLGFVKDFLTNVDLTENSRDFNIVILSNLAEYRTCSLREQNNDATKEETEDKFMSFIDTLASATKKSGASESFLKNEYVKALIKTYHDNEDEIELTPISKQMKLDS